MANTVTKKHYTDADGAVFVQRGPGQPTEYIGACWEAGDIPKPGQDAEPFFCRDANREFQVAGNTASPPGKITTTLTGLMSATANWLERFADDFCPFWVYFTQSKCGSKNSHLNWERNYAIEVTAITDRPISNFLSRDGANPTTQAFNLTANPFRIDNRTLVAARQTTVEANSANDIFACPSQCGGICGAQSLTCETLYSVHDAVGGGTAKALRSTDGGTTWAATAADPFIADEDIIVGACYNVSKGVNRVFVIRGLDVADNLEGAYSDDNGATWTLVDIGSTNGEAVVGPQALHVIDSEHMWACTDDGNVFFSSDGGVTWTDQAALGASGANALHAITFENYSLGYAVGAADTVIKTVDGGTTWSAVTATGGGNINNTVQVFDSGQHVIAGDSGGDIYHSFDGATTWGTALAAGLWPPAGAGSVKCIEFANEVTGYAIHDTAGPVGTIYETVDGGYSWRIITAPANIGVNSIIACNANLAYIAGEVQGGTAYLAKVSG